MDLGIFLSILGVVLSIIGILVTIFNVQLTRKVKADVQEVKDDIKDFGSVEDEAKHCYQNGRQVYAANDFENAKIAFEKAIEISPNYSQALFYLGHTYKKLGENTKAKTVLQKAIDLGHKNAARTLASIK